MEMQPAVSCAARSATALNQLAHMTGGSVRKGTDFHDVIACATRPLQALSRGLRCTGRALREVVPLTWGVLDRLGHLVSPGLRQRLLAAATEARRAAVQVPVAASPV